MSNANHSVWTVVVAAKKGYRRPVVLLWCFGLIDGCRGYVCKSIKLFVGHGFGIGGVIKRRCNKGLKSFNVEKFY